MSLSPDKVHEVQVLLAKHHLPNSLIYGNMVNCLLVALHGRDAALLEQHPGNKQPSPATVPDVFRMITLLGLHAVSSKRFQSVLVTRESTLFPRSEKALGKLLGFYCAGQPDFFDIHQDRISAHIFIPGKHKNVIYAEVGTIARTPRSDLGAETQRKVELWNSLLLAYGVSFVCEIVDVTSYATLRRFLFAGDTAQIKLHKQQIISMFFNTIGDGDLITVLNKCPARLFFRHYALCRALATFTQEVETERTIMFPYTYAQLSTIQEALVTLYTIDAAVLDTDMLNCVYGKK